jgi:hypothetical protein
MIPALKRHSKTAWTVFLSLIGKIDLDAQMRELAEIRTQMDFWSEETTRLFNEAMEAFAARDYDRYKALRAYYHVAVNRYKKEVSERLERMKVI